MPTLRAFDLVLRLSVAPRLFPNVSVSQTTKTPRRTQAYRASPAPSLGTAAPVENRHLPVLVLLFIGSGCAALIYEIVWFQLLSLIIGSSAVSLGVLLGTFMGGMCIGSLFLSKYISRQQHPLRVYAMLEAAIARVRTARALGTAVRRRPVLRDRRARHERICSCAACSARSACCRPRCSWARRCRPSRAGSRRRPKASRGSASSTAATSPARCSAVCSPGFYLLRVHDMAYATYVAVAIDIAVALASLALAQGDAVHAAARTTPTSRA